LLRLIINLKAVFLPEGSTDKHSYAKYMPAKYDLLILYRAKKEGFRNVF